jgi:hypothetical protein
MNIIGRMTDRIIGRMKGRIIGRMKERHDGEYRGARGGGSTVCLRDRKTPWQE